MHANTFLLLAFAAVLPVINAQMVCETTDGSPTTEDVTLLINQIKDDPAGNDCNKGNDHGSDCITIATLATAGIAVCGSTWSTGCSDLANRTIEIQNACLSNGKVGGQLDMGNLKVEVINSGHD